MLAAWPHGCMAHGAESMYARGRSTIVPRTLGGGNRHLLALVAHSCTHPPAPHMLARLTTHQAPPPIYISTCLSSCQQSLRHALMLVHGRPRMHGLTPRPRVHACMHFFTRGVDLEGANGTHGRPPRPRVHACLTLLPTGVDFLGRKVLALRL